MIDDHPGLPILQREIKLQKESEDKKRKVVGSKIAVASLIGHAEKREKSGKNLKMCVRFFLLFH